MSTYGYKETRSIDMSELRNLCIKQSWFTCGDNEEYSELLNMVNNTELTTDLIVELASIIYSHSESDNDHTMSEHITNIMYLIAKASCTLFNEI